YRRRPDATAGGPAPGRGAVRRRRACLRGDRPRHRGQRRDGQVALEPGARAAAGTALGPPGTFAGPVSSGKQGSAVISRIKRELGGHVSESDLSALADGELRGGAAARARRHVESCDACRAELEGLRVLKAMLAQAPRAQPSRSFVL